MIDDTTNGETTRDPARNPLAFCLFGPPTRVYALPSPESELLTGPLNTEPGSTTLSPGKLFAADPSLGVFLEMLKSPRRNGCHARPFLLQNEKAHLQNVTLD